MPALVRLYIRQVAIGFGLSAVFVAVLLYGNVANLWHLVTHTDAGALAVFLLWLFNGIVFASVQFGIAIMRMARDDGGPKGGTTPRIPPRPVPVRAEAPMGRADKSKKHLLRR